MATLHRAVALKEVNGLARGIGQNLNLDVAGAKHSLLQEHRRVAERALGLAHGLFEGAAQLGLGVDPAHTAATATRHGLGEDRKTDLVSLADQQIDVF